MLPGFPGWDALGIIEHIDTNGSGGMCLQNNSYLAGLCMTFGWQARIVNISHEVCEVWNDEFAKWIYIDAHRVNQYLYDPVTAEPLSGVKYPGKHISGKTSICTPSTAILCTVESMRKRFASLPSVPLH